MARTTVIHRNCYEGEIRVFAMAAGISIYCPKSGDQFVLSDRDARQLADAIKYQLKEARR